MEYTNFVANNRAKLNGRSNLDEACGHCGMPVTTEGYDGCVGFLPGVMNACCGHGVIEHAYVQLNHENYREEPNKFRLQGKDAIEFIKTNNQINKYE